MTTSQQPAIKCSDCEACCCRLEVVLISETGVPANLVAVDEWGMWKMKRLDDGWCSALDRNTLRCTIYSRRPQVCRDFEAGEYDCVAERDLCGLDVPRRC